MEARASRRAAAPAGERPAPARSEPLPPGVPTKVCPDCAETVLAEARICKHCRLEFEGWTRLLREVG